MARPVYTESEYEAIRNDMIQGALTIFREQGRDKLTLRNLAAHLRLSHTKLYRYFKNKEELVAEVKVALLEELLEGLTETATEDGGPWEQARHYTAANLRFGVDNPEDYKLVFSTDEQQFRNAGRLIAMREKIFDMVVAAQQIAIDRSGGKGDARTRAHLAWALFHGLIMLHADHQLNQGRALEDLIEPAVALLRGQLS